MNQDTATIHHENGHILIVITEPYSARLTRALTAKGITVFETTAKQEALRVHYPDSMNLATEGITICDASIVQARIAARKDWARKQ